MFVYLDHAATTPMDPQVADKMMKYMTDCYGNPGALYHIGRRSRWAVENARGQVAALLHTTPEHIIFTSSGSEGNNMIVNNCRFSVCCSEIEHDSVLRTAQNTAKFFSPIKVNSNGEVTLEALMKAAERPTGLVSVMYINNETGVKNDIKTLAKWCAENYIPFHSDCVQAIGNYDINVDELGLDFATISAHKINGPKGVGAIYVRDLDDMYPLIYGGLSQERGLRGGTENVPGIVGFGKACEIALEQVRNTANIERITELKRRFYYVLRENLGNLELHINGTPDIHSKTMNLRIDGVDVQSLILSLPDICISAGSACSSLENTPSHVLKAMGLTDEECDSSFRISVSPKQTDEEIDYAAKEIAKLAKKLCRKS